MKSTVPVIYIALVAIFIFYCPTHACAQTDTNELSEKIDNLEARARHGDQEAKRRLGDMYFKGDNITQDFGEAAQWYGCPQPSNDILAACRGVQYGDLPKGVIRRLKTMKCKSDTRNNFASAVNLSGGSGPEFEVCCRDSPPRPV